MVINNIMKIRKLTKRDYINYKALINEFRKTEFSKNQFKRYVKRNFVWVIEEDNKKLIGSGTILFEQKLIHNFGKVAHLEDIIISKEYREKGYGSILINYLINVSIKKKCYKIILNCNEKIEKFYMINGFTRNGLEMDIYF